MKQFLRYQVSGSVLIFWVLVFYYGNSAANLSELVFCMQSNLSGIKVITGLASAIPIGVILHQFSVLIKNCVIAKIWSEFDDFPKKGVILKLNYDTKEKSSQYCLERISNLNSFYYVRFDNGFLSPFVAWFVVFLFLGRSIHYMWWISAVIIGVITISYIPKIYYEIKKYNDILASS